MVESVRDTEKQFGVDTWALVELIDIGTHAAQLSGKPTDLPFLALHLCLDATPNVNSVLGQFFHRHP